MSGALAKVAPQASPYEQHRGYVLAVLARRCGWLGADEREGIFHDAYLVLLQKQSDGELDTAAMHPRQLRSYLVQTALNKALDEGKRAERRRAEPIGHRALAEPDAGPAPDELASASLESARLREIVSELPERRQTLVKLRFFFDRTPDEIQGLLDISERSYRRELERAMGHIAERYTLVREGRFCESRRSLILAYVAGIAGPGRARDAAAHLSSCPACAHWAADLREAAQRASALLPLPAELTQPGALERLQSALEGARNGAAELLTGAKQQAAGAVARLDPSGAGYSLGARPGAATAALVGCLAIGGGATYCVVSGIPGLPGPVSERQQVERPQRDNPPKPKPKPADPAPAAAPVDPAPQPRPRPTADPAAKQPQPAAPPPSRPAADQEFGFEQPAPAAPPTTVNPPVAPASGREEFGP